MTRTPTTRLAWVQEIRPGHVDDYARAHDDMWPDLLEAFQTAGIRNYSIFLHGKTAIGYLESDDVERSLAWMAEQDVERRWVEAMDAHLDRGGPGGAVGPLREIWHLDR